MTPNRVHVDRSVTKITAEAVDGAFCLLPRHVDCVAPLSPGLFSFTYEGGEETLALDSGVLVKCGEEVLVSARNAVRGEGVEKLQEAIDEVFHRVDEHERKARSALARLEASFVTRFLGMEEA